MLGRATICEMHGFDLATVLAGMAPEVASRIGLPVEVVAAVHDLCARQMRLRRFDAGELIFAQGMPVDRAVLVVRGVAAIATVNESGEDAVLRFTPETYWAMAYEDMVLGLAGRPSQTQVRASTDLVAATAPLAPLYRAVECTDAGRQYLLALAQGNVFTRGRRERELMLMDAAARYEAFLSEFPELANRISARQLASYLRMTPQYLSQLRTRRRRA